MQLPIAWTLLIFAFMQGCSSNPTGVGQTCTTSADCGTGNLCFATNTPDSAMCMATCSAGDRICAGGEPCLANETMTNFVCYIGGTVDLGGSCASTRECNSSVCVNVADVLACYQPCTVGDNSPCSSSEQCLPVEGVGTDGFCSTPPM